MARAWLACSALDLDQPRERQLPPWLPVGLAKPLRYLAAIEHVLARRLGADMGYVGLITKNPVHRDWWTTWHNHAPYPLDYLAEFCPDADLAAYSRRSRKEVGGLGRNVTVFDNVREWAYSAVREYWRPNGYEAWADAVRRGLGRCGKGCL